VALVKQALCVAGRKGEMTMKEQGVGSWKAPGWLSRRSLIRGTVGSMLGAGLLRPNWLHADEDEDDHEPGACVGPNPIPGGVKGLAPFGIFIHHNPLNPATPLASLSDPSQITDFDGFVGLTHIRGVGTGTNTNTGTTMSLA